VFVQEAGLRHGTVVSGTIAGVLERLVPPVVSFVERYTDPPDAYLFPEEQATVEKAVAKRVREYTTVRHCARLAMAALGVPPTPVLTGERGAPVWPAGLVGAMTHCDGYRAAALARADQVRAIGIDAEPHERLPDGVLDLVSLPSERHQLRVMEARGEAVCWDRLLFCAKESTYKAWFPLTHDWLGFDEAAVTLAERTFTVHILKQAPTTDGRPITELHGAWRVEDGLIATAIVCLQ
jgi:4'-phosphopantetheinyl transferase EntD